MSVNYASGLSYFPWKGKCGQKEFMDTGDELEAKIHQLAEWVNESRYIVVHTGAGISTSAGIPDFRGPKGVWTLEERGEESKVDITFEDAIPTRTHLALLALQKADVIKYIVSQNVDGLHLRSGYPRERISELHGNMFVEKCERCNFEYYRDTPVHTMARNYTGNSCQETGKRDLSRCRGKLKDTILDWEDSLPNEDIDRAEEESRKADLALCLGTSLQIVPSGRLPLLTLKNKGRLVIVNLQKAKYHNKADLAIHAYVDEVMDRLMRILGKNIPIFEPEIFRARVTIFERKDDQKRSIVQKKEEEEVDEKPVVKTESENSDEESLKLEMDGDVMSDKLKPEQLFHSQENGETENVQHNVNESLQSTVEECQLNDSTSEVKRERCFTADESADRKKPKKE